ncbi:MAG: hypothetical protein ABIJ41_04160 [Candidatus Omnitrophota bacterium]
MFALIWIGSIVATAIVASEKNLSVAGFLFLSFFLGPVALLVVLLIPKQPLESKSSLNIGSLHEARSQLNIIQQSLTSLQEKVKRLEERINQLMTQEDLLRDSAAEIPETVESPREKTTEKTEQEGFEFTFGKYWLNRLGVVIFVLGIAFLISYTFQYFNAFAKILTGYLLSAVFLFWGHRLEVQERYKKVAWGILAGGWALMYLTTYAMHYFEATKIITNAPIELWLLALVSFGTIIYNLKYRSWVTTFFTFFLALITIGLGNMDYSTVLLCSLLVGSVVLIAYRLRWYYFLLLEMGACYITYAYWLNPKLMTSLLLSKGLSIPIYQFQIGFGILLISWTLFSVTLFLLDAESREKVRCLVHGTLINAGFFTFLGLHEIYRVGPHLTAGWDEKFWFLMMLAGVYSLFSVLYKRLNLSRLIVVCCCVVVSLLSMAIWIKCSKLSIGFYWIMEIAILFILGFTYREWIYRFLAGLLSVFLFFRLFMVDYLSYKEYVLFHITIKHNILIFSCATLCFYLLGALMKKDKIRTSIPESEASFYSAFPVLGTVLMTFLLGKEVKSKWLSLAWTLEAAGILGLGFLWKQKVYRVCALCIFALASLRVIFIDISGINTIYKIMAFISLGAVLLGVSLMYSKYMLKKE